MDYETEFNVTASQVKAEVWEIQMEKVQYDDYGEVINRQS